jgi:hypothetical protein
MMDYVTGIFVFFGEVAEWSNVPDSKSGVPQGTAGSNPALSAIDYVFNARSFPIHRQEIYRGERASQVFAFQKQQALLD